MQFQNECFKNSWIAVIFICICVLASCIGDKKLSDWIGKSGDILNSLLGTGDYDAEQEEYDHKQPLDAIAL